MDRKEESSRQLVLRAYGIVSISQLVIGLFLFIAGMMALRISDRFDLLKPPYYMGTFVVCMCCISGSATTSKARWLWLVFIFTVCNAMICAGICTLYIYLIEAPLIDYYFLENATVRRIRQAVTGNTAASIGSFVSGCIGLFVCIAFGLGPCDSHMWPFNCSFYTHESMNKLLSIIITILLGVAVPLTFYSSLMSCIHGWVFDFDVVRIKTRNQTISSHRSEDRPVSGFQQVAMFDIEDQFSEDDDLQTSKYNATSSFKQGHDRDSGEYDHENQHEHMRKHNIPQQQQAPNYVAVLNDPAMKQKLLERKSCLQEV